MASLLYGAALSAQWAVHRRLLRDAWSTDGPLTHDSAYSTQTKGWWTAADGGGGDAHRTGRHLLGETHIALYIIIPVISAVVGYVTNVMALQMTFYPLEFTPSPLKFAQPEGQPFGLLGGWQAGPYGRGRPLFSRHFL